LKKWEKGANPGIELNPIPTYQRAWKAVVKLIQDAIGEGKVPSAFSIGTLVIIRLGSQIKFLPEVHGFRKHRGTYTAIGEAKVRMQIEACTSSPAYQVYLDLSKAYDSIDQDQTQ